MIQSSRSACRATWFAVPANRLTSSMRSELHCPMTDGLCCDVSVAFASFIWQRKVFMVNALPKFHSQNENCLHRTANRLHAIVVASWKFICVDCSLFAREFRNVRSTKDPTATAWTRQRWLNSLSFSKKEFSKVENMEPADIGSELFCLVRTYADQLPYFQ